MDSKRDESVEGTKNRTKPIGASHLARRTREWPDSLSGSELKTLRLLEEQNRLVLSRLSNAQRRELFDTIDSLHNTKGFSILEISRRLGKSQSFLWRLCKALAVPTRTIGQANRVSAPLRTKHLRTPFRGGDDERVYLKGFSMGDLNAARVSELSLFVSTTTTHPAFTNLFQSLFSPHGHVYTYPIRDDLGRFKWKVAVRLDRSFDFLLPSNLSRTFSSLSSPLLRAAWLGGFTDADGNVGIARSGNYARFRVALSSSKRSMLSEIVELMKTDGYHFDGPYKNTKRGHTTKTLGITYSRDHWVIAIQRNDETKRLLAALPLRHQEKVATKSLILGAGAAVHWESIEERVNALRKSIARQVTNYTKKAEVLYYSRKNKIKGV